jgi:type IV pilus assembly protein PilF
MGLIYQTEQEAELAEKYFKEALDADSGFTRGRTYLASLYYSQRKLDDALKQFRIASEDVRYPNRAQVFSNLGLIESLQGRTADAIVSYRKSLTLDRNQPPLRLTLASLYAAQEDYVQANGFYAQFRDMVRTGGLVHTPASLELGIDLARRRGDVDTVSSLMLVLKNLYPDSAEYQRVSAKADS